ncbi:MAG: TonB-dependent receptor plug domain-containing protein, partial [Gluconacetobacter diazotrophicus]|nr:TonB-dependent receptor plug domain-containing protein [Gluconacetobacter diazotrophicus]
MLGTGLLAGIMPGVAGAQEDITVSGQLGAPTANGPVGGQAGGGLIQAQTAVRSVSTVGSDYIRRQAPTENAFQLLSPLPGAVVAQSDPLGISGQSSLTIRGLGTDEIGYVLDGMPLNDIAYYTGYPGQFLDTENIEDISLSQGTGDLDTPTINAAGGLVSLDMRAPAEKAGGYVEGAYGSFHTVRGFARVDTGELGHSGVRGFVSYSRTAADNWRGSGRDKRQHVDVRLLKEWGGGNSVSLIGTWNDAITSGYPYVTQENWKQYGRKGPDNYDGTYSAGDTNYWQFFQQPYRLFYAVAPVHLRLGGGRGAFDVAPYAQYGYGNGPGGTVLPTQGVFQGTEPVDGTLSLPGAVDGQAVVRANYQQASYRAGLVPRLSWRFGRHEVEAGAWYDYADDREPGTFSPVGPDGGTADIFVNRIGETVLLPDGRQLRFQDAHSIAQVNALFVGDRWRVLGDDRLVVQAGFREVMVSRTGWNGLPGATYRTGVNSAEPLPRLGMRWQLDRKN